jgi:carboxylesterase type B
MFFIHGGGNYNGQSIFYNGTALVQHSVEIEQPIIYVGINYRLGGFGFLTSPDFNDAGLSNLGLMDQRLALMWVHDHIAGFGGDPEKVTIFGESAGAANCWAQMHYAFTHAEDDEYFRAVITQSGAPGSPGFPTGKLDAFLEDSYLSRQ